MLRLEHHWKQLLDDNQRGLVRKALRGLLWLVSLPYGAVMTGRNWAYNRKWFSSTKPPQSVIISIGNLTAGGTGKTPLLLKLALTLQDHASTAILSRGYRSLAEYQAQPMAIKPGHPPSAAICGDEPHLLAKRLPRLHLFVGRDRRRSADMATEAGARILLLDDAMQHRRLGRDLDIVVIDATDPLGGGHVLPRGRLRESPYALSRAHYVVVNGVKDPSHLGQIRELLRPFSRAPMIGMSTQVSTVISLNGETLPTLQGVKVGLFCGIGRPERFRATVEALGAEVIEEHFATDHRLPSDAALAVLAQRCKNKGAQWLLCTEKDRVKLSPDLQLVLPIACVEISLEIVDGHDIWQSLINDVKGRVVSRR